MSLTRRLTVTLPESLSRLLERVKLSYQGRRHVDSVAMYALQYGLRAFEQDPGLFFAEQAIQLPDQSPNPLAAYQTPEARAAAKRAFNSTPEELGAAAVKHALKPPATLGGPHLKAPAPIQFPALPRNDYPVDPPTPTLDESPPVQPDEALDVEQLASLLDHH